MSLQRTKALLLILIDFTKEIEMHEATNLHIIIIILVKYFIKNLQIVANFFPLPRISYTYI